MNANITRHQSAPKVSVVLGTYNRLKYLKKAIASVRSEVKTLSSEIIVIDGGSNDGTIQWLCAQQDLITIIHHNRVPATNGTTSLYPWGYFMNIAFRAAHGTYILMLSDDTVMVPGSLSKAMLMYDRLLATSEKIGAIAFYWRDWLFSKEYHITSLFGSTLNVAHGIFLRSALEQVGWINERDYEFYCADYDLSMALTQHGYRIYACPQAFVEHFALANPRIRAANAHSSNKDRDTFFHRWVTTQGSWQKHMHIGEITLAYVDTTHTGRKAFDPRYTLTLRYALSQFRRQICALHTRRKLWP